MLKRILISLWEVLEVVLIAVATVFVIRTFLIQPFLVSGASMEPNFGDRDYLIVDQLTYRFREPARGEVVVFRYPNDPGVHFIKRIIGLPGEEVRMGGGSIAIINAEHPEGFTLTESYLAPREVSRDALTVRLAGDEYFVLGDNRNFSFDSRNWGPVTRGRITGIVRLRLFPFQTFEAFAAPEY